MEVKAGVDPLILTRKSDRLSMRGGVQMFRMWIYVRPVAFRKHSGAGGKLDE
jgi:hypothetical protein